MADQTNQDAIKESEEDLRELRDFWVKGAVFLDEWQQLLAQAKEGRVVGRASEDLYSKIVRQYVLDDGDGGVPLHNLFYGFEIFLHRIGLDVRVIKRRLWICLSKEVSDELRAKTPASVHLPLCSALEALIQDLMTADASLSKVDYDRFDARAGDALRDSKIIWKLDSRLGNAFCILAKCYRDVVA